MCKFIGISNERVYVNLAKRNFQVVFIVYVAMVSSVIFTCQVSACELQPFSCHDLANDIYSQTAKTVFSHLNVEDVCGQYKVN